MAVLETYATYILFAMLGTLISVGLSFIPSLHAYNVVGFAVVAYLPFMDTVDPMIPIMIMIGITVGYATLSTISFNYLTIADDSIIFYVLPTSKYLMQGRGHEATVLSGMGALVGMAYVVLVIPLCAPIFVVLRNVLSPFMFLIIGFVVSFYIMSEWPKDFGVGKTPAQRLWDGWSTLIPGLFTFFMSSIFGMIIFYKTFVPMHAAFQSIMPAIVGLFAVPSLVINLISNMKIPKQHIPKTVDASWEQILRGSGAGLLGGAFASFIPAVTAGPASLMAGHFTAQRSDRMFIISGGACRFVYYVGAVALFFLPGLNKSKGGLAIMINLFFVPETTEQFYLTIAAIALTGFVSFFLLLLVSRGAIRLLEAVNYKYVSLTALVLIIVIVAAMTSWQGMLILIAGGLIGMVPAVFHARRGNCLAVILTPIMLNMAGVGPTVAGWMGLL